MAESINVKTILQRIERIAAVDLTDDERRQMYDDISPEYNKCYNIAEYTGPKVVADCVASLYPSNPENVKILDIAAGTGMVGEKLYERGFRVMDGLDYSAGMLDEARKLGIYGRLMHTRMSSEPLDVEKDTYDCIVIAGGYGGGTTPYDALTEMIRIVKSGGYIVIVTREYFGSYDDYMKIFLPLCDELQNQGKWTKIEISRFEKFLFGVNGQKVVYRVS